MQSTNWGEGNFVSFTLNGQIKKVSTAPADTSLNTYIREYAKLKGTKFMCQEGGCGSCVVSLQYTHPATGQTRIVSVNSCMFPLYACHGCKVTTTEGIGNRKIGYNEIQSRLAHFNGSQCGYCTTGFVMSMYSLLQENSKPSMEEVENSLSGNLCRCTGYRPILDAFKSFAYDKSKCLEQKVADIEDVLKICSKSGVPCHGKCKESKSKRAPYDCVAKNPGEDSDMEFLEVALALPSLRLEFRGGSQWYRVDTVDEIFEIFLMVTGSYMLVGGNTAQGIIKGRPPPDVFIDINGVSFLKDHRFNSNHLYVGANTTLADAITLFRALARERPGPYSYLEQLARHIERVANTPVRNVGTLAGNLQIKHQQRSFPSDVFLIFETVGARLAIRAADEAIFLMSLPEFLETDMYKKVILQIIFPPLDSQSYVVKTYKIAPRALNAVAYVNGGFRFRVNKKDRCKVLEFPTVVFGGINPNFIHAFQTEKFLNGCHLLDSRALATALSTLGREVKPNVNLPQASPKYRAALTQALLYRLFLSLDPSQMKTKLRSGGDDITRPLSSGKQEFDTDSSQPPLYKPTPKLEALLQCSGEAEYVYDIPTINNDDLYAAIVITKRGPAVLGSLDASDALKIPGVVAFFSAKDIPGQNTFITITPVTPENEELFVTKNILYAGQCVGVVVAVTQNLADTAAECVKIVYKEPRKPVLDVREVVRNKDESKIYFREERKATAPKSDVKHVIRGEFKMDTQYHFTMENMSCLSVPIEDGLDVYCTTQWLQGLQEVLTLVLNIPENRINLKLRRLGGSYGQRISRCGIICAACSLAAYLLQRPVRMNMKLETTMEAIGKRSPVFFKYETGVNDEGEIQYLKSDFYIDCGISFNDVTTFLVIDAYNNVYDTSRISFKMFEVKTEKTSCAWTRAPGTLGAVTFPEQVMEHIAHELNKDPLDVRMRNFDKTYPIKPMVTLLQEKADYKTRKIAVENFNKNNLWKKRGITLMPMRFPINTVAGIVLNYHATISVYRNDGTVALVHGGVEMGQGVNTKAAQVCASFLGIPLRYVSVKPTNNFTCPNNQSTQASMTSETVCYAVEQCCKELNKRLEPYRKRPDLASWEQIVQAAYTDQVDLKTTYMYQTNSKPLMYNVYGIAVTEVEIDILTGEHKVVRVDVLEDAGKSLNPFVDVGQVEGAFIMGLGNFTSEEIVHDPETGRVLSNRTLFYEIPGAKDIPVDFRVYLLKNSENPLGVLRSKAVGEPPLCLSVSVMFAIRQALRSARKDLGLPDIWLPIDAPFTAENTFLSCGIGANSYSF